MTKSHTTHADLFLEIEAIRAEYARIIWFASEIKGRGYSALLGSRTFADRAHGLRNRTLGSVSA